MTPRPPLFPYGPNVGLVTRVGVRVPPEWHAKVRDESNRGWELVTFVATSVAELARRIEPGGAP